MKSYLGTELPCPLSSIPCSRRRSDLLAAAMWKVFAAKWMSSLGAHFGSCFWGLLFLVNFCFSWSLFALKKTVNLGPRSVMPLPFGRFPKSPGFASAGFISLPLNSMETFPKCYLYSVVAKPSQSRITSFQKKFKAQFYRCFENISVL